MNIHAAKAINDAAIRLAQLDAAKSEVVRALVGSGSTNLIQDVLDSIEQERRYQTEIIERRLWEELGKA